jgi:uncharacterized protein
MEIRIEQLRERPRPMAWVEPVAAFPLLAELAGQGLATFTGEIRVELVATLVGSLVEAEGTLECSAELPCSRCLQPVLQYLTVPVALVFSRQAPVESATEDERELSENEIGLIPFEGDVIDLRSAIEQEVLMALPQHPLCRGDCAGLCPVCGADLNEQSCGCVPPQFHGALAALKDFKVKKA